MSTIGPAFGGGFIASLAQVTTLERTLGMPEEGPKCVPMTLDFTATDSYDLDFSSIVNRAFISMVQTVFVDTSTSGVNVTITVPGSQQIIKVKAGTQGYYPILMPNPIKFKVSCPG